MKRHALFTFWKTQYSKDVNFPPNWSIHIMQFLSKSQQNSVLYIEKLILKFILKGEGIRTAKTILKKKNEVGEIALPEVKVHML